jgi:hypothetical protein
MNTFSYCRDFYQRGMFTKQGIDFVARFNNREPIFPFYKPGLTCVAIMEDGFLKKYSSMDESHG